MIVEDEPQGTVLGVVSIQVSQQGDKLPAAVTALDPTGHVARMQIQGGQNGAGPPSLVFMIASEGRMFSRYWRQVRRRVGDGLHSRLFIHRNRNHLHRGYPRRCGLILQGHFLIHQQDFPHLAFKSRIAALQVVGDLVRLQGLRH